MLGTTLRGRYNIIRALGKGAFGETYLAKDRDLPGNPYCVVKRLKPQVTDPFVLHTAMRLFDREAQVLDRLGKHDQIPRLLAHFQENEEFYLAQEFIDGNDLSKELTLGKQWNQDQVIAFLLDVLKILEFVHQQEVIHRDIKPANLIRRASDNKIVLIDFGSVKEIRSLGINLHGKTIIGTPGYMPIEQISGEPKLSSDIYALGMTAIQALTGTSPEGLPRHPGTTDIIWHNLVQVSPQLAAILDKMVRYDFRQRYQSANEVLQAILSLKQAKKWSINQKISLAFVLITIVFFIRFLMMPTILKISDPLTNNSLIYQNPAYGINIKYPKTWVMQEIGSALTNDVAKFSVPPKSGLKSPPLEVTIEIQDLKQPTSLQDYTNSQIHEIKQFLTNAKINDQHPTTLANLPAEEVIYTGNDGQYIVKQMAVWMLKNNRVYIITYTAEESQYDKFLNTAQAMINSLEIR